MGPTGAGKSALALEIAQSRPTVIINADAMQMVSALRVLSARPSVAEEAQAEHALYGVLPPASPTSVAVWLGLVGPVIRAAWAAGKQPLLVGGTGMYVKALMDGLADIPAVPKRARGEDAASLHALLAQKDPRMAARLKPGDTQRIVRALEVIEGTGVSLAAWQERASPPLFPGVPVRCFAMLPERAQMYARIDRRFHIMMENGALEEVRVLMGLGLDPALPILRAHGVPELMAHLRGDMTREDAIAKAQQNTRNYAKRQMTWIRHQLPAARPATVAAMLEPQG